MHADGPVPSNNDSPGQPAQGLPPVKPPSGRFILQLFLIPGLIVAGLVLLFVFGGLAWIGTSSPESFLSRLDSNNPDIRWRAANELAQVLKRPESLELASDPKFALDIADRLEAALTELTEQEYKSKKVLDKKLVEIQLDPNLKNEDKEQRKEKERTAAGRKLAPQRNLALYLISCLGDFTIPVGVPLLGEVAMNNQGFEPKGLILKRRRAVWALANLGDNVQRHYFGKNAKPEDKVLSNEQKAAILAQLKKEAAGDGNRAKWARTTYGILEKLHPSGVDKALEICALGQRRKIKPADDIFLRELVALALNFWDGDRVEPTLLQLARDNGHGKRFEINEED
jgi:hypothetical protein